MRNVRSVIAAVNCTTHSNALTSELRDQIIETLGYIITMHPLERHWTTANGFCVAQNR